MWTGVEEYMESHHDHFKLHRNVMDSVKIFECDGLCEDILLILFPIFPCRQYFLHSMSAWDIFWIRQASNCTFLDCWFFNCYCLSRFGTSNYLCGWFGGLSIFLLSEQEKRCVLSVSLELFRITQVPLVIFRIESMLSQRVFARYSCCTLCYA